MSQIPGNLIVGAFSIIVGVVEIVIGVVVGLKIIKPKGNEAYRYDLQWVTFGVVQITLGLMVIFG